MDKKDNLDIEILFDSLTIKNKIKELGKLICQDYKDKKLCVLIILKGGFIFAADLIRQISLPMVVEFLGLSSYGSQRQTSGVVRIMMDTKYPLAGYDVLVVEDIVDTGLTLSYLLNNLKTRNPQSIKVAALFNKKDKNKGEVKIDYCGFNMPDKYIVGYGLDDAGKFRNLPYVGVIK